MFPIVDLWRSIAVIFVVIAHVSSAYGQVIFLGLFEINLLGKLGVVIFFVLTSFVLMLSLDRLSNSSNSFYKDFMIRRFFRIFPLSIFIVVFYYIFELPSSYSNQIPVILEVSFFGFLQNLFLIQNFTVENSIMSPLWSLPYEFQMYLTLPFIYLFYQKKDNFIISILIFLILILISFVLDVKIDKFNDQYLTYMQFPEFLIWFLCFIPGLLAYFIHKNFKVSKIKFNYFWLILIIIILGRMFNYDNFIYIISSILVGLSLVMIKDDYSNTLKKISFYISKYSYSIYLTHMFALDIGLNIFGKTTLLGWFIFLSLLILLPVITYHLIEEPFMKYGKKFTLKYLDLKRN